MTRASRFAVFSAAIFLLGPALSASADTITITGGFLDMVNQLGRLELTGDRGFTLSGLVDTTGGIFAPQLQCSGGVQPCTPGAAIDLDARWSGNDLPATVTLDGTTYPRVGDLAGDTSASVAFSGGAIAPPLDNNSAEAGSQVAFVQAPFTFDGFFFDGQGRVPLVGSGVASLWLRPEFDGTAWTPAEVRYDFAAAAVVTPEPATLALIASGLLITAGIMRRRPRV